MKIEKFNENINQSNWDDNKIKKYSKLKGELEGMTDSFNSILLEYLMLNPKLQEGNVDDLINDESYIESFDIYLYNPYTTVDISYFPSSEYYDAYNAEISKKQYLDFLEFLKNPELYQSANKYNL